MRGTWQALLLVVGAHVAGAAEPALPPFQWRTVPAEELAMTEEPAAPGAAAVYLYTELSQRPARGTEQFYRQIKVLTEQGRNYANITIQYRTLIDKLSDIEARVIQPDGSITPFTGKVYDRELVSGSLIALHAKTLALPDVHVGSIVEYRYAITYAAANASQFHWMLNQELFTRLGKFSNRPIAGSSLQIFVPRGWPKGSTPARLEDDGTVRMEARNLPAFVAEDFMPPQASLVQTVEFVYSGTSKNPDEFWSTLIKSYNTDFERGLKVTSVLRKTAEGLINGAGTDEQKARKIYDHVQQLGNTDFEGPLSAKEATRRERYLGDPLQAYADVGKRGFGNSQELTLYCVALLRAAGLAAQPTLVAGRYDSFFDREARRPGDLNATLASVRLGDHDMLLDPAVPYLPFGVMSWFHTAVEAVKLDANGGQWLETPAPQSADAVAHRDGRLKLSAEGVLEGTVTETVTGQYALTARMALRLADAATRKTALEAGLKAHLPQSAVVKLIEQPDWNGIGTPLQVKYQVTVPDWVVTSGSRLLVGFGLFGANEKGVFVADQRQQPIYFGFPFEVRDELHIELPDGYHLESPALSTLPSAEPLLRYHASVASDGGALVLRRELAVGVLMASASSYPRFRNFFQTVRGGDEQQILLAR